MARRWGSVDDVGIYRRRRDLRAGLRALFLAERFAAFLAPLLAAFRVPFFAAFFALLFAAFLALRLAARLAGRLAAFLAAFFLCGLRLRAGRLGAEAGVELEGG